MRNLRAAVRVFRRDEAGGPTVEWVVLTASAISITLSVFSMVAGGSGKMTDTLEQTLSTQQLGGLEMPATAPETAGDAGAGEEPPAEEPEEVSGPAEPEEVSEAEDTAADAEDEGETGAGSRRNTPDLPDQASDRAREALGIETDDGQSSGDAEEDEDEVVRARDTGPSARSRDRGNGRGNN